MARYRRRGAGAQEWGGCWERCRGVGTFRLCILTYLTQQGFPGCFIRADNVLEGCLKQAIPGQQEPATHQTFTQQMHTVSVA